MVIQAELSRICLDLGKIQKGTCLNESDLPLGRTGGSAPRRGSFSAVTSAPARTRRAGRGDHGHRAHRGEAERCERRAPEEAEPLGRERRVAGLEPREHARVDAGAGARPARVPSRRRRILRRSSHSSIGIQQCLDALAEARAGAFENLADRRGLDAEGGRDFARVEPGAVAQAHDRALALGQLAERDEQRAPLPRAVEIVGRIGGVAGRLGQLTVAVTSGRRRRNRRRTVLTAMVVTQAAKRASARGAYLLSDVSTVSIASWVASSASASERSIPRTVRNTRSTCCVYSRRRAPGSPARACSTRRAISSSASGSASPPRREVNVAKSAASGDAVAPAHRVSGARTSGAPRGAPDRCGCDHDSTCVT